MADPLERLFPIIKAERKAPSHDPLQQGGPGEIPGPPPTIGETKNKVIASIEGTTLIATGAAVATQGVKVGTKTVAKGFLTGIIGGSAEQIAVFNAPFLLGPVNELIEEFSAALSDERNLPRPQRPFLDLQGPARSLIGVLSFLPGTSESASRKLKEIEARDLQPQVTELIARTEGLAARTDLDPFSQGKELQRSFNETLRFIQAGGDYPQLRNLALGIDLKQAELFSIMGRADRDKFVKSYLDPQGLEPPRYGPFVKFILTNGKDGLPGLHPNRGDP